MLYVMAASHDVEALTEELIAAITKTDKVSETAQTIQLCTYDF
jgi:hypothetical protein